jgi:hypothetical protein
MRRLLCMAAIAAGSLFPTARSNAQGAVPSPAAEPTPEPSSSATSARTALAALVPYDLDGGRTLQALSVLRGEQRLLSSGKRKQELAFMRALALSDLYLIARSTQRSALEKQVAEALDVEPSQLPQTLDAELAAVEQDVVRDIVQDARRALKIAQGSEFALPSKPGPRSQATFLGKLIGALGTSADARASVARLAPLADDPCAQPANACDPLYRNFDKPGRQAVHALVLAEQSVKGLEREVQDPFVMALMDDVANQTRALRTVMLVPNARIPQAPTRVAATEGGVAEAPDVLVLVALDRVEYTFMPRVRVNDAGKVTLEQSDEPTFPTMAEVKIEGTFAPFVRPIDAVTKALSGLRARFPQARVAVGAAPDIKAHVVARTLLSARAAGFEQLAMLGANPEGEMRSVGLEIVGALQAGEVGPRELSVVVRLGGFSVKRAGPTVSIPRLKNENGFVFDFQQLIAQARPRDAKSAKLTFMSDVAFETLAEAAFLMAPRNQALTVVLP